MRPNLEDLQDAARAKYGPEASVHARTVSGRMQYWVANGKGTEVVASPSIEALAKSLGVPVPTQADAAPGATVKAGAAAKALGISISFMTKALKLGLPYTKHLTAKHIDLALAKSWLENYQAGHPDAFASASARRRIKQNKATAPRPARSPVSAPGIHRRRLVPAASVARALHVSSSFIYRLAVHDGMPSVLISPGRRRFVIADCLAWWQRHGGGRQGLRRPRRAARATLTGQGRPVTLNAQASVAVRHLCDRIGELTAIAVSPSDQASAIVLKAIMEWQAKP